MIREIIVSAIVTMCLLRMYSSYLTKEIEQLESRIERKIKMNYRKEIAKGGLKQWKN